MAFTFDKKINQILKEANLPKALSDDLRKELESYFYEKEQDLKSSGLKSDDIQKHLSQDFGDADMIGRTLQFVHKKSFYSFIKSLMKNQHKPYIFETTLLLTILYFLHRSILSDSAIRTTIASFYREFGFYNEDVRLISFLIILLALILVIRLYRGGEISQKIASMVLSIAIVGSFGYNYFSPEQSSLAYQNKINSISDQDLIENPEKFDESSEAYPIQFYNEKDGYSLSLPLSYMVFRQDGTSDLVKYFTFPKPIYTPEPGEIVAFGPAYSSDKERIDVKVFDLDNSPDKTADETWKDYYLRTQLKNRDYQIEPVELEGFFGNMPAQKLPNVHTVHLSKPLKIRQDILVQEYNNRLYTFLHNAKNPLHKEILGIGAGVHVPEEKINWITFDLPECPFTLKIPDYWEQGYIAENGEHIDMDKCESPAFVSEGYGLYTKNVKTQNLENYLESEKMEIIAIGEAEWEGLPAKRFLVKGDYDQQAGFAVETKKDQWLIFLWYPDKLVEKVMNTLQIKQ